MYSNIVVLLQLIWVVSLTQSVPWQENKFIYDTFHSTRSRPDENLSNNSEDGLLRNNVNADQAAIPTTTKSQHKPESQNRRVDNERVGYILDGAVKDEYTSTAVLNATETNTKQNLQQVVRGLETIFEPRPNKTDIQRMLFSKPYKTLSDGKEKHRLVDRLYIMPYSSPKTKYYFQEPALNDTQLPMFNTTDSEKSVTSRLKSAEFVIKLLNLYLGKKNASDSHDVVKPIENKFQNQNKYSPKPFHPNLETYNSFTNETKASLNIENGLDSGNLNNKNKHTDYTIVLPNGKSVKNSTVETSAFHNTSKELKHSEEDHGHVPSTDDVFKTSQFDNFNKTECGSKGPNNYNNAPVENKSNDDPSANSGTQNFFLKLFQFPNSTKGSDTNGKSLGVNLNVLAFIGMLPAR